MATQEKWTNWVVDHAFSFTLNRGIEEEPTYEEMKVALLKEVSRFLKGNPSDNQFTLESRDDPFETEPPFAEGEIQIRRSDA
jgi:hypothetical protein|tara:strand:- start:165 stop:410 length:246 start_codon:yes stop_codon:yes gene_type:complete